jgi:hypothetical protein
VSRLLGGGGPFHATLTTADGVVVPLLLAPTDDPQKRPRTVEGTLTPADATQAFQPAGVPQEWSDFSAGGGYSFEDSRVPNGYAWAKNVWTMQPNAALPSGKLTPITFDDPPNEPYGEITRGVETETNVYLTAGRHAIKIPQGTGTPVHLKDFVAESGFSDYRVTSVCLYLGRLQWGGYRSDSGAASYLFDHTVETDAFAHNDMVAWHVGSVGGVDAGNNWAEWLFASVANDTAIRYTNSTTPITSSNWTPADSAGLPVGSQRFSIQNIVTARQSPYLIVQDGVYAVQRNGQYIPNITPHHRSMTWQHNGVASTLVSGRLFTNLFNAIDMVVNLDGQVNDTPFFVQPGADLPNETPVAGNCWAMCQDGDWLVAAIYNTGRQTSYLCWGKPRSSVPGAPGIGNFIWHMSPCVIEGERVTWMKRISPFGEPRLLIATRTVDTETTKLYWMSLPRDGSILQDLASGGPWRARTDTCTLYLSSRPASLGVTAEQAVRHVAAVSKNCSNTSVLKVHVDPDETGRTQVGANVLASPYQAATVVADVHGRQMAPSVDFVAGSETEPPVLRALRLRFGEGVEPARVRRMKVIFAEGAQLANSTAGDERDPELAWNQLLSAQGPRPAELEDQYGNAYTVAFLQGAAWTEQETTRKVGEQSVWRIEGTVQFIELARHITYGDGTRYGLGALWGA